LLAGILLFCLNQHLAYGLFEKNPPMAYVYLLGQVCPDRQLFSIIPTAYIKEQGNPAMLTNPVLIEFVPWPRRHHWNSFPFIWGRVLMIGGKSFYNIRFKYNLYRNNI
jgi:hypothetical protein